MILDIATMLAAISRDWEDVRALTHCAIKNAHCTDGAHSVGDDATAPLPLPIKCMSGH